MSDLSSQIVAALRGFDVSATVVDVQHGPAVDRYCLVPAAGTKVATIARLENDLALATGATSVRIIAPIPGTRRIGVEVPAAERRPVTTDDFGRVPTDHPLRFPVGKAVDGSIVHARFDKLPHLLVAGTTGSGKSVFVTTTLSWIVTHSEPADVRLVLIDPKRVELADFAGVPHLIEPVAVETEEAISVLGELAAAMDERYSAMAREGVKNVADLADPPPYVLLVVDELADLMMTGKKRIEEPLVRLLQMGRAAGIHALLATQRPSATVLTGLIRSNVPSRMVFAVQSHVDSGIALGMSGAQNLTGAGDGLWLPAGASEPERVQAGLSTLELPYRDVVDDELAVGSIMAWAGGDDGVVGSAPQDQMLDQPAGRAVLNFDGTPNRVLDDETAQANLDWWLDAIDAAREEGYEKGRQHAVALEPPPAYRRATIVDWILGVLLWFALCAILGTLSQFPLTPVLGAVYVAYIIIRRRRRQKEVTTS